MCNYYSCWMFLVLVLAVAQNVRCVTMNINPSMVVIQGSTSDATTTMSTTPATVTFECLSSGTSSINGINALYILRKRSADNDFTAIAEITNHDNEAELSYSAPQDIRNKQPTLSGSISRYDGSLTMRILVSRMDCNDESTYQCLMNYKPINLLTTDVSTTQNLIVTVIPGHIQITATRIVDYFPIAVANRSTVTVGQQLEFSCTGDVGRSQSTLIQWQRRPPLSSMFERYTPTNNADSIDNGVASTICPYVRTTKLRYTWSTSDTNTVSFRCEVVVQESSATYTAHSEEFHVISDNFYTNGSGDVIRSWSGLRNVLWLTILYCTIIWTDNAQWTGGVSGY